MASENGGNPGIRRLGSWKEIAAFVGRDERTVKRWEDSRGLPVRRVPGSGKAAVFAYEEEIENWIKSTGPAALASPTPVEIEPPKAAPRSSHDGPKLFMLLLVTLVVLAGVVFAMATSTAESGAQTTPLTNMFRTKSPPNFIDQVCMHGRHAAHQVWRGH